METRAGPRGWRERGCLGAQGQSVTVTVVKITPRAADAYLELHCASSVLSSRINKCDSHDVSVLLSSFYR